ncbi:amino acid adenylation domain-containing protein [Micromonospora sp. DT201]|uniref:amino acid adenylation domain-containing protein n=1 Tax=Micromonospora sp. DT201 TaxID=3393442 RepID=UPI003CEA5C93
MAGMRGDRLGLTAAQSGMWLAQQLDLTNPTYSIAECVEIRGAIDPVLFERALRRVVTETDALRIRFDSDDSGPWQVVQPEVDWSMHHVDVADDGGRAAAEVWMRRQADRPVNLSSGPVFTHALIKVAADDFIWFNRSHHAAVDGYSGALIAQRVAQVYTALVDGTPVDSSPFGRLSDLVEYDAAYRGSDQQADDREYWTSRFADRPVPVSLAAVPPAVPRGHERLSGSFGPELTAAVLELSREAGMGWPTVVLAGTAAYLARMTGVGDVILGMAVAGRQKPAARRTPGMVSNALPIRVRVRQDSSVAELLDRVNRELRLALRHQRYRYEDLHRDLGLVGTRQRLWGPEANVVLFDYNLSFAEHPASVRAFALGPEEDLSLLIDGRSTRSGMRIDFHANADLYRPNALANHRDLLRHFLHDMTTGDPQRSVGRLTVTPDDRAGRFTGHTVYILDAALRPVPAGGVGELYLPTAAPKAAGVLLATAVADPFGGTGSSMARTGQLVRRHADGMFELVGALPVLAGPTPETAGEPAPDDASTAASQLATLATVRQEQLRVLFAEALSNSGIGLHDNFFEAGGHSLTAIRVLGRIRATFRTELSIKTIFEAPTVALLAERIEEARESARPELLPAERPERLPLSLGQRGLWFLDRLEGPNPSYHHGLSLRLSGDLDRAALRLAIGDLLRRHENLRTSFPEDDGEPWQRISPAPVSAPDLEVRDIAPADLATILRDAASTPFDLAAEPPVRALLFALSPTDHVLMVVMHHIISDGLSLEPLLLDLADAYVARLTGEAPRRPPLTVQYADFTVWQRRILGDGVAPTAPMTQQVGFWRTTLAGAPQEVTFPADHVRPEVAGHAGDHLGFEIDAELHGRLTALARERQVTLFMVFHAAVAVLLSRLGAGTDVVLGSPVAGRGDAALDAVVGFFVNTLVLRTDLSGDPEFGEVLARVREGDLAAYANQDVPFERLVEALNPVRSLARHPLFQVMLALQNASESSLELPGLRVTPEPVEVGTAKFDLELMLDEHLSATGEPSGITGKLEYSVGLFTATTVGLLAERLIKLLRQIVEAPATRIGAFDVLAEAEIARAAEPGARLVLGPDGELLPTGVPGDIHILARADADGAVAAPIGPAGRYLRRTGEQGRWRADGTIEMVTDDAPDDVVAAVVPAAPRQPRTPAEEILRGLYAEMLNRPDVDIDSGFFDLGGHSLSAIRLLSRMRSTFGVELPVRALFEAPSVAELAGRLQAGASTLPSLVSRPRPDLVPLSSAQRRLWFIDRFDGVPGTYNMGLSLRLTGAVDVAALRAALADVMVRHESLRTVFPDVDGTPYQLVLPAGLVRPELPVVPVPVGQFGAALTEFAMEGFDLAAAPAVRACLFRLADAPADGEQEHVLMVVMHHIISDGWSQEALVKDLATAYTARLGGAEPAFTPLPVQYADYALWEREVHGDEQDEQSRIGQQLRYWREHLAGLPEEMALPLDRVRPGVASYRGGVIGFEIDAELHGRLTALARERQVTLFMVFHAAVAVLLSRLGAGTDVVLGSPVAGRGDAALDAVVGFFVNTLVLRTDLSGDPEFGEVLARVREGDLAAYANQDVPFERLVEALNPVRSLARHPLFQVMLALQNASESSLELPGLRVTPEPVELPIAKWDLLFELDERVDGGGIDGRLEFATDIFDASTAQAIADRLLIVLRAVSADASRPIGQLDLLSTAERETVLTRWGRGLDAAEPDQSVPEAFAEQVRRVPDATAVLDASGSRTYRQVDARVNQLSHRLLRLGVRTETAVGMLLRHGLDVPVAQLGVLRAGGVVCPLDARHPDDRLRWQLDDSGCVAVVTDRANEMRATAVANGRPVIVLDAEDALAGEPTTVPAVTVHPDQAMSVLYTSGSTGLPKGVVIRQRAVLSFVADPRFGDGYDVVINHSPLAFDASTFELWRALLHGGAAVMVDEELDPAVVRGFAERGARRLFLTSGLFRALAEEDPECFGGFEEVWTGGDVVPPKLVRQALSANPGLTVVDVYGPTETTSYATTFSIRPEDDVPNPIPIGVPLHDMRAYVLDERLNPVPPRVEGELYLGGGHARGYLHRPGATADHFVADPFGPAGGRLYRTGDRVRWRTDGALEFTGRADSQVKIRGFRIELGEIEAVLGAHPVVRDVAVEVSRSERGDKRIVAYVVPAVDREAFDGEALREHARARLAEYMLPAAIMTLEQLPLTANGKLDRRALPAPDFAAAAGTVAARDEREQRLCDLFADVLSVPSVGIEDSFFELGGDSILSIQLVARARRAGLVMTAKDIFEHQTVARLAKIAAEAGSEQQSHRTGGDVGRFPLTPVMHWWRERGGTLDRFNQTAVVTVPAGLGEERLAAAVQAVVDGHGALRLTLSGTEREWIPEIRPVGAVRAADVVRRVEVAGADDVRLREVLAAEAEAAWQRLDPLNGTSVQIVWFDAGPQQSGRLLVTAHHLAVDGVSWRILLPDLQQAWETAGAGTPSLEPATMSVRRWAERLVVAAHEPTRVAELPGWERLLREPEPALGDPSVGVCGTGRRLTVTLPADRTAAVLTTVPKAYRARVDDVLLAALAAVVLDARRARGLDNGGGILVNLESHGREEIASNIDLSRTVGWFTSICPVRLDPEVTEWHDFWAGGRSVGRAIKSVKEQLAGLTDRGLGYGLLRYLNPETAPRLAALAAPQISFNYLGRFDTAGPEPAADWALAAEAGDIADAAEVDAPLMHPLEVTVVTRDGPGGPCLQATWAWSEPALSEQDVRRFADAWHRALDVFADHAGQADAGGHTPSDLSLMSISQDDIDLVESDWRML